MALSAVLRALGPRNLVHRRLVRPNPAAVEGVPGGVELSGMTEGTASGSVSGVAEPGGILG